MGWSTGPWGSGWGRTRGLIYLANTHLFHFLTNQATYKINLFSLTLGSRLAAVHVLLLPGPAILKPDLGDPLAEPGDLGDSLEVLAVGVGVNLEVGLEDLDLILGEGGPHPLGLLFRLGLRLPTLYNLENISHYYKTKAYQCDFECVWTAFLETLGKQPASVTEKKLSLTVWRCARSVHSLHVVRLAQYLVLAYPELLAGGELPLAGVAGEAGQVVDLVPGFSDPICRRNQPTALEALGTEHSTKSKAPS